MEVTSQLESVRIESSDQSEARTQCGDNRLSGPRYRKLLSKVGGSVTGVSWG